MIRSSVLFLGCSFASAHSNGSDVVSSVSTEPDHASNCYGFPDQPFTPSNYVNICNPGGCEDKGLGVKTNDIAPNFSLSSVSGERIKLYDLLENKPTFIQFGSFT